MKMKRLTFAFLAVFLTLTVCSVKAEERFIFLNQHRFLIMRMV